jgi:hypothetical protein
VSQPRRTFSNNAVRIKSCNFWLKDEMQCNAGMMKTPSGKYYENGT